MTLRVHIVHRMHRCSCTGLQNNKKRSVSQSENQRDKAWLLKKKEYWHGMESEWALCPAGIYCNPKVPRWAPLYHAPESLTPTWREIISIRISSQSILVLRTNQVYLRSECPSITAYPVGRAPAPSRLRAQGGTLKSAHYLLICSENTKEVKVQM